MDICKLSSVMDWNVPTVERKKYVLTIIGLDFNISNFVGLWEVFNTSQDLASDILFVHFMDFLFWCLYTTNIHQIQSLIPGFCHQNAKLYFFFL